MNHLKNKIVSLLLSKFNVGKIDKALSQIPLINTTYKFFAQRAIDYQFPTHIFIEPTSACNFRCEMCPRTHGNTIIGNMEFSLFKKIVDEARLYGPRSFCLHLFGEPLLAPKIIEMFEYIKKSNPSNAILFTTNGALLDEIKAKALVDWQVDKIAISFTSPDQTTYQEKTGVDQLKAVENNINNLLKIKAERKLAKPLIFVRMIVQADTEKQTSDFLKKWRGKKVIAEIRDRHNYGGNVNKSHVKKNEKRYPCYHLWLAPAIHWNGDVSICCDDYASKALLGNVQNKTINEMWNGEKINHFRKLHLQGKYNQMPLCGDCDVWNMYADIFFHWQKR